MAKKITNTENGTLENAVIAPESPEDTTEIIEVPESEVKVSAMKSEGKSPTDYVSQEIPEHADRILKSFPDYRELYIDFQGGTFTVNTPPNFRTNATLYTNPYYKKP